MITSPDKQSFETYVSGPNIVKQTRTDKEQEASVGLPVSAIPAPMRAPMDFPTAFE
jgi:hypothetical protein